jgi:drug/metabolite transporter (DMT)-like permease
VQSRYCMIWLIPLLHGLGHLTFPIGKALVAYADPIFTVGIRMLLAGALLLGGLFMVGSKSIKISLKEAISAFILSLFSIYFCNLFEYWTLKYFSSAKTCFFYSMSPCVSVVISCLLSYIHFKEKMTINKWIGMATGIIGFLPVMALQNGLEDPFKMNVLLSWPSIASVAGSFCGVYGWILLRFFVKNQQLCPVKMNAYSMLFGGLLALITSFFTETPPLQQLKNLEIRPYFGWMILIIFISNIICTNLYGYLLKRFSASLISFVDLLSPLFASVNAYLFLNEPFHPIILLSTTFVTFGLFIIYRIELKQGYILTSKALQTA